MYMRRVLFLTSLFFVLVFASSCTSEDPNDQSLSSKDYQKIGLPDPSRVWESNDVSLAFAVLENLQSRNSNQLPLNGSKKSGKIFERMLQRENMTILDDDRIPGMEKLSIANTMLKLSEDWFRIYTRDAQLATYYQDELTAILLYGMAITSVMLAISDEMQANGSIGVEMLSRVRARYLTAVFAILGEQLRVNQYSARNQKAMAEKIVPAISQNMDWIEEVTKEDLKHGLTLVSQVQSDQKIIDDYNSLISKL